MAENPNTDHKPNSMEKNLVVTVYSVYYLARKVFRSHRKERKISEYICVALRKKYNSIPDKDEFITNLVDDIQLQGMTEKELLSKLLELTFEMGASQREKLLKISENLVTFAHSQELNRIHDAFNIERNISYQIKSSVMSSISENAGVRGVVMATLTVVFALAAVSMPIVAVLQGDAQAIPATTIAQIRIDNSTTQKQIDAAMHPLLLRIEFDKFVVNGILSQDNIVSATTNSSVYNVRGYGEVSINLNEFSYLNSAVSYRSDDNLLPFRVRIVLDNESLTRVSSAQSTIEPSSGKIIKPANLQTFITDDGWIRIGLPPKGVRTTPQQQNASITDASITDASITDASITDASIADASIADASMHTVATKTSSVFYHINDHAKIIHYFTPTIAQSDAILASNAATPDAATPDVATDTPPIISSAEYLIVNAILSSEALPTEAPTPSNTPNTRQLEEQIALSLLANKQVYAILMESLRVFIYAGYARNSLYVSTVSSGATPPEL